MRDFKPSSDAYLSTSTFTFTDGTVADVQLVPLRDIEPPIRQPEFLMDWRGLERHRIVDAFTGFVTNSSIPPINLLELTMHDISGLPFKFRVIDGMHRFYASVAAGFIRIPATIREECL